MRWFIRGYPEHQFRPCRGYGAYWTHIDNCCGVREIGGLNDHTDPAQALYRLCLQGVLDDERNFKESYTPGSWIQSDHPKRVFKMSRKSGLFIFTGVTSRFSHYDLEWKIDSYEKYVHNFACYIKKHRLGTVTMSPEAVNEYFHTNHKVQVGVWAVDWDRLIAWFMAMVKKEMKWNEEQDRLKGPLPSLQKAVVAGGGGRPVAGVVARNQPAQGGGLNMPVQAPQIAGPPAQDHLLFNHHFVIDYFADRPYVAEARGLPAQGAGPLYPPPIPPGGGQDGPPGMGAEGQEVARGVD